MVYDLFRRTITTLLPDVGSKTGLLAGLSASFFAAISLLAVTSASAQIPAAAVLQYRVVQHELAVNDPEPLLQVFADGTLRAYRPFYMQHAGRYELRLSAAEMDKLSASLEPLANFDQAAAEAAVAATRQSREAAGDFWVISDDTDSIFVVRQGAGPSHEVSWTNLAQSAARYSNVDGLAALSATEDLLRQLARRVIDQGEAVQ